MSDKQRTVFISYRRSASKHLAGRIFDHLRSHDYDVFLDVETIDSGEFDRIILNQIPARAHFIVVLSPGSLRRCVNEGDWLRREIEEAMRLKRNIVPIIDEGFDFEKENAYLPEEWREKFTRYNGLRLFRDYFDDGMEKLRNRFLKEPVHGVEIRPTPEAEQTEVQRRIQVAQLEVKRSTLRLITRRFTVVVVLVMIVIAVIAIVSNLPEELLTGEFTPIQQTPMPTLAVLPSVTLVATDTPTLTATYATTATITPTDEPTATPTEVLPTATPVDIVDGPAVILLYSDQAFAMINNSPDTLAVRDLMFVRGDVSWMGEAITGGMLPSGECVIVLLQRQGVSAESSWGCEGRVHSQHFEPDVTSLFWRNVDADTFEVWQGDVVVASCNTSGRATSGDCAFEWPAVGEG